MESALLKRLPWLTHGFTTRRGGYSLVYGGTGDLNLGFTSHDDAELVRRNRDELAQRMGGGHRLQLATARQVHGTAVLAVRRKVLPEGASAVGEADGLMTAEPGLLLGIQVADCVPVLLADSRKRVVAAVHAGWRGTVDGIVRRAMERMRAEYECAPEEVVGAIGPSIGPCCYTVEEDVKRRFGAQFAEADELFHLSPRGTHLDLWMANRRQMLAAGLLPENISVAEECTACAM